MEVLHRGNVRNPDVLLIEVPGGRAVVKDFAPRGAFVRSVLGPLIHGREIRAYRALEGSEAVPRFLGRIDRLAFAVEYRPGRRMSRKLAGQVPAAFLEDLERVIRAMHERGVAHLDLRHRSNVMVDEHGCPVLIDFASAVCFRPGGLAARLILPRLAAVDLGALRKWKQRLVVHSAGDATTSSAGERGASRPM